MKDSRYRRPAALALALAALWHMSAASYAWSAASDRTAVADYALTGSGSRLAIEYEVEPGGTVRLDREDFRDFYESKGGEDTPRSVTLSWDGGTAAGALYYDYDGDDEQSFSRSALDDCTFYYRNSSDGDYALNRLTFAAARSAGGKEAEFSFAVSGDDGEWSGRLTILVDDDDDGDNYGEITYQVRPGSSVDFRRSDFNTLYRRHYSSAPQYVVFTSAAVANGSFSCGSHVFDGSTLADHRFYYSSSDYGDYSLDDLSFSADSGFSGSRTIRFTIRGAEGDVSGAVLLYSTTSSSTRSSSSSTTISYYLAAGEEVPFLLDDFLDMTDRRLDSSLRYVTFTTSDSLTSSAGMLYRLYGRAGEKSFTRDTLSDYQFYAYSSDYGDYPISELSFAAPSGAVARTFRLRYTLHDARGETAAGYVEINLSRQSASSGSTNVTVTTDPQTGVTTVTGPNGSAVVRPETGTNTGTGTTGTGTGSAGTSAGTNTNTNAGANTNTSTSANAGGPVDPEDGPRFSDDALYMDSASEAAALLETAGADIHYTVSNAAPVRIGAGDLRRFFLQSYPNGTLERVRLLGIPSAGRLYYNYYSSSRYGSPFPRLISASDAGKQDYYLSPAGESQFSLWELYFSPAAGTNACALIPFTAYGADAIQSVRGTILISATNQPVGEVYGVTTRDTPVGFPTEPIRTALTAAAGTVPASIRLLDLPPAAAGTLYEEGGESPAAARTGKGYAFPAGTDNLRFVPAPGFTGTVSIPYAALDAAGTAYAAGSFSIGVVNSLRQFPDVDASSWCVKYVTELADAGVLGGYPDGTFQPDRAVTYGAALKLILLSAGYPEQQETNSNTSDVFARYLEFARAQGIVSGTVDLSAPITRLQVAKLAAAAMKLSGGSYGSGVFTDTSDPSVLALHALGILNGYDVNGVSQFRPGNTLTRGQLAAIVWRIRNYR